MLMRNVSASPAEASLESKSASTFSAMAAMSLAVSSNGVSFGSSTSAVLSPSVSLTLIVLISRLSFPGGLGDGCDGLI